LLENQINVQILPSPVKEREVNPLAHRLLISDLQHAGHYGELFEPLLLNNTREIPLEKIIDAGTCWVVKQQDGVYAKCLPSFLIIGAQKAGTDEVAVWL